MALHGKTAKTERQVKARRTKPSRAKRIGRRWDERVDELRRYLATRDYAFRVEPFISMRCYGQDPARAFRIAEYLAKRAERKALAKVA